MLSSLTFNGEKLIVESIKRGSAYCLRITTAVLLIKRTFKWPEAFHCQGHTLFIDNWALVTLFINSHHGDFSKPYSAWGLKCKHWKLKRLKNAIVVNTYRINICIIIHLQLQKLNFDATSPPRPFRQVLVWAWAVVKEKKQMQLWSPTLSQAIRVLQITIRWE